MKHTAFPWEIFRSNQHPQKPIIIGHPYGWICELNKDIPKDEAQANAEFIVRACNYHEELTKTLNLAITALYNNDLSSIADFCNTVLNNATK